MQVDRKHDGPGRYGPGAELRQAEGITIAEMAQGVYGFIPCTFMSSILASTHSKIRQTFRLWPHEFADFLHGESIGQASEDVERVIDLKGYRIRSRFVGV